MTGFVSHECEVDDYTISWEIKTLNHRFFDMSFKLPENLRCLECELRNIAKNNIKRGKMEVMLSIKSKGVRDLLKIAPERLAEIAALVKQAQDALLAAGCQNLRINPVELIANPAFTGHNNNTLCEELREKVVESFGCAIKALNATRAAEGKLLEVALTDTLCSMKQIVAQICIVAKENRSLIFKRLLSRVEELANSCQSKLSNAGSHKVDYMRLEQEVLIAAQKADIQEELDRLNTHLCAITGLFSCDEAVGRKLDFLMQELNREANTICSKAADAQIVSLGVALKTYIEQMREQVQNIE